MTTEILIITYRRDLEFTTYCLRSIAKFATGFSGVTVAFPEQDAHLLCPALEPFKITQRRYVENKLSPFNHHQSMKCHADILCPDADMILHLDSDCLFNQAVTPETYMKDGKPILWKEAFARFGPNSEAPHPNRYGWKAVTEKALGFPVEYETMCRHPAIHPRWLYPAVRSHIETLHKMPFGSYVLGQREVFPQGFTEFPTLGAYAHRYAHSFYHWVNIGVDEKPPEHLRQFWTKGGVTELVREEMDRILA